MIGLSLREGIFREFVKDNLIRHSEEEQIRRTLAQLAGELMRY